MNNSNKFQPVTTREEALNKIHKADAILSDKRPIAPEYDNPMHKKLDGSELIQFFVWALIILSILSFILDTVVSLVIDLDLNSIRLAFAVSFFMTLLFMLGHDYDGNRNDKFNYFAARVCLVIDVKERENYYNLINEYEMSMGVYKNFVERIKYELEKKNVFVILNDYSNIENTHHYEINENGYLIETDRNTWRKNLEHKDPESFRDDLWDKMKADEIITD